MAVKLSPFGNSQFVNEQGAPASGWLLNCYAAGSVNTPLLAYTDATGGVAQSNPIVLNTLGFPTIGQVWLAAGQAYKFVLTDALGVVKKTVDNISGVNDTGTTTDEWADTGVTPTYVSPSSYTLVGDQTTQFHVGRRQKFQTTAGTVYGCILTSAYTTLTTVTMQMDGTQALDNGLSSVQNSILRANVLSLPGRIATTTGAVNVYVASVGIARLALGDEFKIKFAIANDGSAAPTLNLDGTGALALLLPNGAVPVGGSINGEHKVRVTAAGFIVLNPVAQAQIQSVSASVAANALTLGFAGGPLSFRSATLASGTPNTRAVPTLSLVVPSGATLGTVSGVQSRLYALVLDVSPGVQELAVVNASGGNDLSETGLISTTAISAAATAANVVYSTTARTNVPYRVVEFVESTQAVAGTWATAPSTVQGYGGQALASMSSLGYGQTWQNLTGSRTNATTYYNTTSRPITVVVQMNSGATNTTLTAIVNGVAVILGSSSIPSGTAVSAGTVIIPPMASYSITLSSFLSLVSWCELR